MIVSPGVYSMTQKEGGNVHCFLIEDTDGKFILLDTGYDDDGHIVRDELAAIGKGTCDIKLIALSHAHKSHISGLAELQRMSKAPVAAAEWEIPIIQGTKKAARVGFPKFSQRPRSLTVWKLQVGLTLGLGSHTPCEVHQRLKNGDKVGPLEVIETPGHTPGSICLWYAERKILFAADTICTWPAPPGPWEGFTLDEDAYWRSIALLADLPAVTLCSGHGDPVGDAQDVIRRLRR